MDIVGTPGSGNSSVQYVRFRMNDGSPYEVSLPISPLETIFSIKKKLESMYNFKSVDQTLFYNNKVLNDTANLLQYRYHPEYPIFISIYKKPELRASFPPPTSHATDNPTSTVRPESAPFAPRHHHQPPPASQELANRSLRSTSYSNPDPFNKASGGTAAPASVPASGLQPPPGSGKARRRATTGSKVPTTPSLKLDESKIDLGLFPPNIQIQDWSMGNTSFPAGPPEEEAKKKGQSLPNYNIDLSYLTAPLDGPKHQSMNNQRNPNQKKVKGLVLDGFLSPRGSAANPSLPQPSLSPRSPRAPPSPRSPRRFTQKQTSREWLPKMQPYDASKEQQKQVDPPAPSTVAASTTPQPNTANSSEWIANFDNLHMPSFQVSLQHSNMLSPLAYDPTPPLFPAQEFKVNGPPSSLSSAPRGRSIIQQSAPQSPPSPRGHRRQTSMVPPASPPAVQIHHAVPDKPPTIAIPPPFPSISPRTRRKPIVPSLSFVPETSAFPPLNVDEQPKEVTAVQNEVSNSSSKKDSGVSHPRFCAVSGPKVSSGIAGELTTFTIVARDQWGNGRTTGGEEFVVLLHGPAFLEAQVTDQKNGMYIVSYKPEVRGLYDMFVGLKGIQIAGSPFSVLISPGPTDAASCVATGDGLTRFRAGNLATFFLQSRDRYGNNCNTGGDKFSVKVQGPETCHAPIRDDSNGTYTVHYTTRKSGDYAVSIILNRVPIMGSPFRVISEPGPTCPPDCTAVGTGLSGGVVGQLCTFSIEARDQFGNRRTTGGDPFRVSIPGSAGAQVQDNNDGTWFVSYSTESSGALNISVTLHGLNISGSPFQAYLTGVHSDSELKPPRAVRMPSSGMLKAPQFFSKHARIPSSGSLPLYPSNVKMIFQPKGTEAKIIKAQSLVRRWLAQRHYHILALMYRTREKVVREILTSEESYVGMLDTLRDLFLNPLRKSLASKPIINADRIGLIFSNISFIRSINGELLLKLRERIHNWNHSKLLGDVFVEMAESLQYSYSQYINNYDQALKTLSWCQQNEPAFVAFLENARSVTNLDIGAYLIAPVQRLPRYYLLLKEVVNHTEPNNPDYLQLSQAMLRIKNVTAFVNENRRKAENLQKIISIQSNLTGKIRSLFHLNRIFLEEGLMNVVSGKTGRMRHVFLFSDIILITKSKKTKDTAKYKTKEVISIDKSDIREFVENGTKELQVISSNGTYFFSMENPVQFDLWLEKIKDAKATLEKAKQLLGQ